MDCLDRTNVVQAYMNKDALADILSTLGILRNNSIAELEENEAFLKTYRNSWADHGNLISIQYAGTGALKTDYTRTGVRTLYGELQDGWKSVIRYVKNNFKDGTRTDGIKFVVGELSTNDVIEVETLRRQNITSYLPYIMLGIVVLMSYLLLELLASGLSFRLLGFCAFCIFLIWFLFDPTQFVDYPSSVLLTRHRNQQGSI